jgi:hypothetical protein
MRRLNLKSYVRYSRRVGDVGKQLCSFAAWAEESNQTALVKAIGIGKLSLQQGIAQVAKGTEVPTEAKYEMEDGKLSCPFTPRPRASRR